jgi:hypothetical protein
MLPPFWPDLLPQDQALEVQAPEDQDDYSHLFLSNKTKDVVKATPAPRAPPDSKKASAGVGVKQADPAKAGPLSDSGLEPGKARLVGRGIEALKALVAREAAISPRLADKSEYEYPNSEEDPEEEEEQDPEEEEEEDVGPDKLGLGEKTQDGDGASKLVPKEAEQNVRSGSSEESSSSEESGSSEESSSSDSSSDSRSGSGEDSSSSEDITSEPSVGEEGGRDGDEAVAGTRSALQAPHDDLMHLTRIMQVGMGGDRWAPAMGQLIAIGTDSLASVS